MASRAVVIEARARSLPLRYTRAKTQGDSETDRTDDCDIRLRTIRPLASWSARSWQLNSTNHQRYITIAQEN
jgi:hypothetical protein